MLSQQKLPSLDLKTVKESRSSLDSHNFQLAVQIGTMSIAVVSRTVLLCFFYSGQAELLVIVTARQMTP